VKDLEDLLDLYSKRHAASIAKKRLRLQLYYELNFKESCDKKSLNIIIQFLIFLKLTYDSKKVLNGLLLAHTII